MAPHSSTLAWNLPWTEEPGRLWSMGSLRVRHDWATSLSLFTFMHWRRKWQPTPVFLPGESQGQRILVGCHLWGHTESDTTAKSDLAAAAAAAAAYNPTKFREHVQLQEVSWLQTPKMLTFPRSKLVSWAPTKNHTDTCWGQIHNLQLLSKGMLCYAMLSHFNRVRLCATP